MKPECGGACSGIINVAFMDTWAWATYTALLAAIVAVAVVKDGWVCYACCAVHAPTPAYARYPMRTHPQGLRQHSNNHPDGGSGGKGAVCKLSRREYVRPTLHGLPPCHSTAWHISLQAHGSQTAQAVPPATIAGMAGS